MYKESTNSNEINVVVTLNVISPVVKDKRVSFDCNKVRTKMTIDYDWSIE